MNAAKQNRNNTTDVRNVDDQGIKGSRDQAMQDYEIDGPRNANIGPT